MSGLVPLLTLLDYTPSDPPPDDKVVAGKVAFAIFVLLIAVIAFLGWNMVKQFRKVDAAKAAGLYDESRKEREAREAEEAERVSLAKQSGSTESD